MGGGSSIIRYDRHMEGRVCDILSFVHGLADDVSQAQRDANEAKAGTGSCIKAVEDLRYQVLLAGAVYFAIPLVGLFLWRVVACMRGRGAGREAMMRSQVYQELGM